MARGVMGKAVFEKILSEISRHKDSIKVVVMYHGGEPLLNRNFYSMVAQIKKMNSSLFVKTVSNGMALTEKHAADMISSGIDSIEFSLDGESPEESQHVREKSNTRRIVANIKRLLELKRTSGCLHPDVYIATTQFVRHKGLAGLAGLPEAPKVPAWLMQEFGGEVAGFKSDYAVKWPHMGDTGQYDFVQPEGVEDRAECDLVINTLTVRADGAVVPCCYDLTSRLVMGNILETSLADIWNGRKYSMLRQSIATKRYASICATCSEVRPPVYLVPKWQVVLAPESARKQSSN